MSQSRSRSHLRPLAELLNTFTSLRTAGMSRRELRHFIEVVDSLRDHFKTCNVKTIDLMKEALDQPRRKLFSAARVLDMLADFEDDHFLAKVDVDPDYRRRGSSVVRDFARWLRGQVARLGSPS